MSISDENKKKLVELSGAQYPSYKTQKRIDHALRRFKYNFPSLNWWGNTPIEPTGAGLTYAESITTMRHIMHHLSDWAGQMNDELRELQKDLADITIIINQELADQLPDIIQQYDLFDLIVTGNNERISEVQNIVTTTNKSESVFSYAFRTEYGFIEAVKTKETTKNEISCNNDTTWIIHSNERSGSDLLDFYFSVKIPAKVNRIWLINQYKQQMDGKKEIYFLSGNQIKKVVFDKLSDPENVVFETLNTNYAPYWIINVFKRTPNGKNYLQYMTLDYKVYEYDLVTGNEELLYRIPVEHQDIFDPINDVISGKSTIWAVTYKGTTNRYIDYMQGLCFEPCTDGVELYDTWETPKQINFTKEFSGIVPANMYQEYANADEKTGDKALLSSFILTEKNNEYVLLIDQLTPRKYDNSIISDNLNQYFDSTWINDLVKRESLADYQGVYTYRFTDAEIENFNDAPSYLFKDTKNNDGALFTLKNSKFYQSDKVRTFHQTLQLINTDQTTQRVMKIFERDVQQTITKQGLKVSKFTRWYDDSQPIQSETINTAVAGKKFDYLSLAGTKKVYKASEFESNFDDTPVKVYKYYELPVDKNHPLLQELEKKNVIIEVTKGTNFADNPDLYETVIKLTYQDDYAELQFRRAMRFTRNDFSGSVGGRNKATFISPWAYVYYTTKDDTAPPEYEENPNQGIDQKFNDIINNLQQQITNIDDRVTNVENDVNNIKNDIKNIKQQITEMNETINNLVQDNELLNKIIEKLKEIGIWSDNGFKPGMGIAGGNINIFSGSTDGNYWIKTSKDKKENDLAGGV